MGLRDLPLANGQQHARAFERCGWVRVRQSGSHMILTKPGHRAALSIPDHAQVKRTLIARLIKVAGLTEEEYLAAFRR